MAYNPKTGKGLGRFYDANHRAFRAREWRGFRDTFYDFFRWLYLYGFMAVKLGCHPILMVKAMMPPATMPGMISGRITLKKA